MMKKLTIGILTYNRALRCVDNILKLLNDCENFSYQILVIDDGGSGEVRKKILERGINNNNLEIISHDRNLGFAESFCELLEFCKTDYLIWLPDDDYLVVKLIPNIQLFLSENEPDFVSTLFYRDGKIMRGRGNFSCIDPKDFWESSFHAPGLIYRIRSVGQFIPLLRKMVKQKHYASYIFPQVVLSIYLFVSEKKCVWVDIEIVYEKGPSPSSLKFIDGRDYKNIESRMKQLESFEALIIDIESNYRSRVMEQIHNAHRNKIISTVLEELGSRSPLSLESFQKASLIYFAKLYLKRFKLLGRVARFIKKI